MRNELYLGRELPGIHDFLTPAAMCVYSSRCPDRVSYVWDKLGPNHAVHMRHLAVQTPNEPTMSQVQNDPRQPDRGAPAPLSGPGPGRSATVGGAR